MRAIVRPLPVLYACQGCPRFGQIARDAGAELDRRGLAELVWLGSPAARPSTRYPLIALDGCAEACARRWLCERGVTPQKHFVLRTSADVDRIACELTSG